MSRVVTIAISDTAASMAQELAQRTERRVEDVLADWIDRAVAEPPTESLSDDQIRLLCSAEMSDVQQEELGELLARRREGILDTAGQERLGQLMAVYRHGLVRKAQALQVAVERGLIPPLP